MKKKRPVRFAWVHVMVGFMCVMELTFSSITKLNWGVPQGDGSSGSLPPSPLSRDLPPVADSSPPEISQMTVVVRKLQDLDRLAFVYREKRRGEKTPP